MIIDYEIGDSVYAIDFIKEDDLFFYRIEKAVITSIHINNTGIDFGLNSEDSGEEYGDTVSEKHVFKAKEDVATELLKLNNLI